MQNIAEKINENMEILFTLVLSQHHKKHQTLDLIIILAFFKASLLFPKEFHIMLFHV